MGRLARALTSWLHGLGRRGGRNAQELGPDPAAELRAKIAATRELDVDAPAEPTAEPEPAQAAPDPAARRQAIHERARGAIDDLG